jgi:hypothetical protein
VPQFQRKKREESELDQGGSTGSAEGKEAWKLEEEAFDARHLDINLWDSFEGDWTKANLDDGSIRVLLNLLWGSEEDGAKSGAKMCGGVGKVPTSFPADYLFYYPYY